MKDYSLLDINKQEFLKNWTDTYLKELNNKVFSLYNYNNFFIPDFLKEDPNNPESPAITNYSQIPYHHWYRVLDSDIDWTEVEEEEIREKVEEEMSRATEEEKEAEVQRRRKELQQKKSEEYFLGAKAGFAVLSYARNENELDKPEGVVRQNEKYYTVVPSSWGSFYDFYVSNGVWYFTFDPQAEEKLGRTNLLYNIDSFNSRFFIKNDDNAQPITGSYGESIKALFKNAEEISLYIIDKQSHLWTDIQGNPVMGFNIYKETNDSFGEEIVLDTKLSYSRVAKSNTAVYTIKDKSGNRIVPSNGETDITLI